MQNVNKFQMHLSLKKTWNKFRIKYITFIEEKREQIETLIVFRLREFKVKYKQTKKQTHIKEEDEDGEEAKKKKPQMKTKYKIY